MQKEVHSFCSPLQFKWDALLTLDLFLPHKYFTSVYSPVIFLVMLDHIRAQCGGPPVSVHVLAFARVSSCVCCELLS